MLLERQRELGTLDRIRTSALAGRGAIVLIEGPAGVGKSALLGELTGRARGDGMRVLTSTGGELERDFPFGVVRQLLEPELLAADGERRERLLSGAASAAAPALGLDAGETQSAPDAGFATLHGLYWLVAALAEERPLLLVLDDAHWADAPSLRFADFLARRLAELGVLVAVGVRSGEPGAEHGLLAALADSDVATSIRPGPLSPGATREFVNGAMGGEQVSEATDAAHQATGGNPLLLRELVRSVGDDVLSADVVHDALPSSVTRSVERRLHRLPQFVRDVAVSLAVLGDRADTSLLAAVTGQSGEQVLDALDALRTPELVTGEPAAYTHPLLREAVRDTVSTAERHRLHAEAARELRNRPESRDRLVAHLLAAPPLGRPWAADALRAAGLHALTEGAPEAAASRLRRALEESGGRDPGLLLELGTAESMAGDPAASQRLAEAQRGGDPLVAARAAAAQVALGSLAASPDVGEDTDQLRAALERLGPDADPDLVDQLTGVLLISMSRDPSRADQRRELIAAIGDKGGDSVFGAAAIEALNSHDGAVAEVKELAQASLASNPLSVPHKIPGGAQTAAFCLASVDEPYLSDQALRQSEQTARRAGSRFYGAVTAATRGEWYLLYGSMRSAEESARQAYELLEQVGGAGLASVTRSTASVALTRQGRLDEAEEVLLPLDPGEQGWTTTLVLNARAELRLAQERAGDALADSEAAGAIWIRFGWRQFGRGNPIALRSSILLAAGRHGEARAVAEDELEFARRTGRVTAEVAALTALGRAQDGDLALATLQAAHAAAQRSPVTIVRAEAALAWGAALRRDGRRAEAREALGESGELAGRIDATLLRDRALEELGIAGGRKRDPFSSGVESLTPSERRVADHAARGLTNREIAETLFVTQKTVEVHLGNTYSKLEIRSRNELQAALGGDQRV